MSIPLLDGAVGAGYQVIAGLATVLGPVGGAVAAIVLCTAALRLLLLPLTRAAVRGERARSALAPRVVQLQRRYAKEPARLSTELTKLYRGAGTSPLAGCLPVLAQSPLFLVWYRIFTLPRVGGHPNALLAAHFLGAPLSTHLIGGGHPLVFVPLLLALLILAVIAMRRSRASSGSSVLALVPFVSLLSALVMPLAAVFYLVTTLSWTAIENALLRRGR
jgi:YidC/Oxa1 family membrane protein insertase